jgi:uncharacterized protein (DUF736 family)
VQLGDVWKKLRESTSRNFLSVFQENPTFWALLYTKMLAFSFGAEF